MVVKVTLLKGIAGTVVLIPTAAAVTTISSGLRIFKTESKDVDERATVVVQDEPEVKEKSESEETEVTDDESNENESEFLTSTSDYSESQLPDDENKWIVLKNREDFFHHKGLFYREWAKRLISEEKEKPKHKVITHITLLGDGVWSLPGSSDNESKIRIEKDGEKWEIPMKTIKGSMNNNDYQDENNTGAGDGEASSKVTGQKAWNDGSWAKIKSIGESNKVGYVHPRTVGGSCDPVILSIIEYDKDAMAPESGTSSETGTEQEWTAPTNVIVSYKGASTSTSKCSKSGVLLSAESDIGEIRQMTIFSIENGLAASTSKYILKAVPGISRHEYQADSSLRWWGKKQGENEDKMQQEELNMKCPVMMVVTGSGHKSWIKKETDNQKCPGEGGVLVWGVLKSTTTVKDGTGSQSSSKKLEVKRPSVLQVENFRSYCKKSQVSGETEGCQRQSAWSWSAYWHFLHSAKAEEDLKGVDDSIKKISGFASSASSDTKTTHSVDPIDYSICLNIPANMNLFIKKNSSWEKQSNTSQTEQGASTTGVISSKQVCGKWGEALIGSGSDVSSASSAETQIFKKLSSFTSLSISNQQDSWQYSKVTIPTLTTSGDSNNTKLTVDVHRYSYSSGSNSGTSSPNWGEVILKVKSILMSDVVGDAKGVHFV